MISKAIAVTEATKSNGCRDIVHMTEPVSIKGPYDYCVLKNCARVYDWAATLTVEQAL